MSIRLIMVVCYVIVSGGNCENSDGKYGTARGRIEETTPGGPPRELKQPFNNGNGYDIIGKSGRNFEILNSTRLKNSKINNSVSTSNNTIYYISDIDTTTTTTATSTTTSKTADEYLKKTSTQGSKNNNMSKFFTPPLPPEYVSRIPATQEEFDNSPAITISNTSVFNITISSLITDEGVNTTEFSSNVTSPQSVNTTLTNNVNLTTSTRSSSSDREDSSHSQVFNYNYLYFLMVVPVAVTIGMGYWVIKKKKPPNRKMTKAEERRMMTPSWVFKEPENEDSSEE